MHINLILIVAGLLAPIPADDTTKDKKALEGTWVVVSATRDGKANDEIKDDKLVIEGDNMTVKTKNKEEKATFKIVNLDKKQIDVTPAGDKTMKGIYKVEGDTLKLCIAANPEATEYPKDFDAKEGSGYMLIELKREKK